MKSRNLAMKVLVLLVFISIVIPISMSSASLEDCLNPSCPGYIDLIICNGCFVTTSPRLTCPYNPNCSYLEIYRSHDKYCDYCWTKWYANAGVHDCIHDHIICFDEMTCEY